jgi:hypothetical protein
VPSCADATCGDDGCDGTCGVCTDFQVCIDGGCECVPTCVGTECGDDGCGGTCGQCDAGTSCVFGECQCEPQCGGTECGDDGCDGTCGQCDVGLTCDGGACVPEDDIYTAVLVLDDWQESGSCSNYNSTGADIDAVEFISCSDDNWIDCETVAFFAETVAEVGTEGCDNAYQVPETAIGAKDGTYIALQGGYIAGDFGPAPPITSGTVIRVHEFGVAYGGGDDPYAVFLMTDLDCLSSENIDQCSVYLGSGSGLADFLVP